MTSSGASPVDEHDGAGPDDVYRRFLEAGTFALQNCQECRAQIFPPQLLCPRCGGTALEWEPVTGAAVVASTTTVRRKPERGGDYDLSLVDLDGGARMLSAVGDLAPAEVRIGQQVRPRIVSRETGPAVAFVPATIEDAADGQRR